MIKHDWTPSDVVSFETKWGTTKLPADGYVSAGDAASLQVAFAAMAEELGDLVAQALYHEESAKFKRDSARTLAWLRSEAKSDKGKDADAANDPGVRISEAAYIEARAYRKLLENRYESAVRSHYAMKQLLNGKEKEEWLG